jgi:hypothetical protein
MADVVMNLIDPLEARYRWDKTPEQIEFAKRDMVDGFRHHEVDLLQAACRMIILTRRFSTMPTVGDINDVIQRIIAERKAATAKPDRKAAAGTFEAYKQAMALEKEDAQAWARQWMRRSLLGQQALRDGWCRPLFHMAWQLRLSSTRAGKPCEDLTVNDFKTADTTNPNGFGEKLIEGWRKSASPTPKLDAAIIMQERFA